MSLTSPAITELTVESATKALLAEWIGDWFDGDEHDIFTGVTTATFPLADVTFDQSAIASQDLEGTEIRIIVDSGAHKPYLSDPGMEVENYVGIDFWVRSRQTNTGTGNSNYLADRVSQLLFALLQNPLTRTDLAQKGIMNMRPQKPKTFTDANYALRLVRCKAQLQYSITTRLT
jgi:hypothetical protein